jgi:membrane-bound lytic murein transglycosylase D
VAVGESKPGLTAAEKRASDKASAGRKSSSKHGYRTHRVRSGQTLSSIARTYKVSIRELRQANDLGSSSDIRAGEKLKVPLRP